ncbi:MAG: hypothetical protein GSR78_02795 [Desulfurococcales archaeon]|nr:hypothetical protein [Desulfurococcales archaeon]
MKAVEEVRRIFRNFIKGNRKGYVLTLLSIIRLQERGEEATIENIVKEANSIIESTRGRIDWGVSSYTVDVATPLLEELVNMGVIEELDGIVTDKLKKKYRIKDHDGEVEREVYTGLGLVLASRCC